MNESLARPKPIGVAPSGRSLYDPEEMRAYREACGVTQMQVADALKVTQTMVVLWEQPDSRVKTPRLDEELGVIERIVRRREAMIASGTAALATIRERCRVAVSKGGRLERCGKLSAPGLTTCAEHVDYHSDLTSADLARVVRSAKIPARTAPPRRVIPTPDFSKGR